MVIPLYVVSLPLVLGFELLEDELDELLPELGLELLELELELDELLLELEELLFFACSARICASRESS